MAFDKVSEGGSIPIFFLSLGLMSYDASMIRAIRCPYNHSLLGFLSSHSPFEISRPCCLSVKRGAAVLLLVREIILKHAIS